MEENAVDVRGSQVGMGRLVGDHGDPRVFYMFIVCMHVANQPQSTPQVR